jgi:hypothetical protein
MDDKKVVNTQHVKYIETLSRIQNLSLLNQLNSSIDGAVEDAGLASNTTNNNPMGGAPELSTPAELLYSNLWNAFRRARPTSASHLVVSGIFYLLSYKL